MKCMFFFASLFGKRWDFIYKIIEFYLVYLHSTVTLLSIEHSKSIDAQMFYSNTKTKNLESLGPDSQIFVENDDKQPRYDGNFSRF